MKQFQIEMNNNKSIDRWELWNNHRNFIKGLFDEVFSLKNNVENIGIIGAGNCDDLDLDYIGSKCNQIILFDLDYQSMYKAIENLNSSTKEKITLVEVDLTNLNFEEFSNKFEELIVNNEKTKKVIKFLVETANNLKSNNGIMEHYCNTCDVVAASAIYSQLFYNWALNVLDNQSRYSDSELIEIIEKGLVYLRDKIVRICNEELMKISKPKAGVVIWVDLFEMEPEDYSVLKQGDLRSADPLIIKKGLHASILGLKSAHNYFDEIIVLRDWIWDFEQGKSYYCRGLSGLLK